MSKTEETVVLKWDGLTLHPLSDMDRDIIKGKAARDSEVHVRIQPKRRSLPMHRLYFAVLRLVLANNNHFSTIDNLNRAVKIASGLTETMITLDGDFVTVASSISFDEMDQDEFEKFFSRATQVMAEKLMHGMNPDDLVTEARWYSQQNKLKGAQRTGVKA